MRILALALGIPFPPHGGGLARTFHLLKALAAHHEVELLGFTYGEEPGAAPCPVRVTRVPWVWSEQYEQMRSTNEAVAHAAAERLTYQVDDPWFVSSLDPALMTDAVRTALHARPDLVLFEGTPLAQFAQHVPPDLPRVLDLFDIHSMMARRALDGAPIEAQAALAREAARTLAFEQRAVREASACLVVSTDDAVAARELLGAQRVHVVPNGVDTTYFTPSADRTEPGCILFTGRMSYEPNADAVCHFSRDILPLVRQELPHARLHVVGVAPPPHIMALQSESVVVHGRVDDVRPFQRQAEVVVVPIRAGGGTRLKVLEAAASGKAIVSTHLGIEGLPFQPDRDVLVTDDASGFAAAVVTLLRDAARRRELGNRAREVALSYDWSAIGTSLCDIVGQLADTAASEREKISRSCPVVTTEKEPRQDCASNAPDAR